MALPIDQDVELKAIAEVLRVFEDGSSDIVQKITAQINAAQRNIDEQALKRKEALYEHIADLYAQGIITTDKQAAQYTAAEMQKQQKDKLASEIQILEYISKEGTEERAKQMAYLEKEKEILQLRADGNEEEARQKEKELARQKKKDKRKQEAEEKKKEDDSYEFGDVFRESFKEFIDEKNSDPAALVKKTNEENLLKAVKGVGKAITDGLNAINSAISEYAKYQTSINARLQGTSSYSEAVKTLSGVAFSPLLRAEDLYSNLSDLVGQGIVTNVEQRAMFATVKDGIATTFDVTSDSLKRLIRLQQNDSTAARLGMEAYLTKFLNVYVENTEYLQSTFDSVSSSLLEASAMMHLNSDSGAKASAELEYVIQKWLGTLSGVGLSDSAAQSIADAIGNLGSGNIDALSSNDIQNLIVMAASKVGLSYGEMLNTGLDAKQVNDLMLGVVKYLQEVAETGTNVVKSQLATVFGVTVSDLVAVSNLSADSLKTVHNDMLSYKNMYGELQAQFDELPGRLGISNILENLFSNLTYQTGMSIGSNPVTYALWKVTDMIQGYTGGINIPYISAFGNGFDLNTSVENLMKLGIIGISTLGNIGKIAGGLGSIGNGSALLKKLKISEAGAEIKAFGGSELAGKPRKSGKTTSENSYVGNSDSDTYYESTTNAANDEQQKKVDAKAEEFEDPTVEYFRDELNYADWLKETDSKLDTIIANQSAAGNASAAANALLIGLLQSGAISNGALAGPDNLTDDITAGSTAAPADTITANTNTLTNNTNTNMQMQASDVTIAALSSILTSIVARQISDSENNIVNAITPAASTLVNIDTSALTIISEISALNGVVLSGVEDLNKSITEALKASAVTANSAYNDYSEKLAQDLNTSYSNVSGDVLNQVQIVKDIISANIDTDSDTVNIQINLPEPNVNVENEIINDIPDVNITLEITNTVPNIDFEPNINVTPNVVVDQTAMIPEVNINPDVTVIVPDAETDTNNTQNITEYDKYLSEQGIVNNTSNNISNTTSDISDYLIEIDFANGFKLLVDNVSKIRDLLEDDESYNNAVDDNISGFTQYTFDK